MLVGGGVPGRRGRRRRRKNRVLARRQHVEPNADEKKSSWFVAHVDCIANVASCSFGPSIAAQPKTMMRLQFAKKADLSSIFIWSMGKLARRLVLFANVCEICEICERRRRSGRPRVGAASQSCGLCVLTSHANVAHASRIVRALSCLALTVCGRGSARPRG